MLLISDTHGYCGPEILKHASQCDEVWHAGDWGDINHFQSLMSDCKIRGVYGNIDDLQIRKVFPEELYFEISGLKVYMTHIGGYPGRYKPQVKRRLQKLKPDLYICGHSHICKVVRDNSLGLMHINPGAIGLKGFHQKRTMMRFNIDNGRLIDVQLLEYDKKL